MKRAASVTSTLAHDEPSAPYECAAKLAAVNDEEIWAEGAQRMRAHMLRLSDALVSPTDVARYLTLEIGGRIREEFIAIWLDNKNRVITFETLSKGTINSTAIHSREVVRSALQHNAAAVVFAHNHPSGDSTPSANDFAITERLRASLELIDVRLLDHFVIGGAAPPVSIGLLSWASQLTPAAVPKARRRSRQGKSA